MDKSFKRRNNIHIIIGILGLILIINIIRIQNYIWLFDGIVLIVSLIALFVGGWGILVPYVRITETHIKIYSSAFKTYNVAINDIKEFYTDEANHVVELRTDKKNYQINLRNVQKQQREQLKDEVEKATP